MFTLVQQASSPGTPAASEANVWVDNDTVPQLMITAPDGVARRVGDETSAATAGQTGFAADTYVAGSAIQCRAGQWRAGTIYRCTFDMAKTGAGTATPIITVRMGTLGTTGDASIMTFTFGAGSAVIDTGFFEVDLEFRSVGSGTSAVLAGFARLHHQLAATGLTTTGTAGLHVVPGASAGFASTTQTLLGLSFNGGASFAGTNVAAMTVCEGL